MNISQEYKTINIKQLLKLCIKNDNTLLDISNNSSYSHPLLMDNKNYILSRFDDIIELENYKPTFKDILNCDLSTVIDVCDEWQRVYVKSFQRIYLFQLFLISTLR